LLNQAIDPYVEHVYFIFYAPPGILRKQRQEMQQVDNWISSRKQTTALSVLHAATEPSECHHRDRASSDIFCYSGLNFKVHYCIGVCTMVRRPKTAGVQILPCFDFLQLFTNFRKVRKATFPFLANEC